MRIFGEGLILFGFPIVKIGIYALAIYGLYTCMNRFL